MAALNAAGYSVQLRHLDDTETDRDDHGHVRLLNSETGDVLAACEKFQHNRSYSNRERLTESLLAELPASGGALVDAESTEVVRSMSQSSL